jgi:phospho-N-acetylmuramoyl-pentapeptide-transferase
MLYYLFQYLHHNFDIAGTGLFHYVSFRALLTTILALLISTIFGNKFIDLLKRKQRFETQRDANIDPFGIEKKGVPSMGGVIIIAAIIIPCLLLGKLGNTYMILMLITTLWLGAVGFADDYIKIFRKNKEGLKGRYKLIAQAGLGLIVGLTLYYVPDAVMRENVEIQRNNEQKTEVVHSRQYIKSTQTTIPFVKENNLDYVDAFRWIKDSEWQRKMGWALFVLVTIFVVAAVSNGANLNDGMDGMAAGNSAIIGIALGILAYVSSHLELAQYLNIMFIPGSEELVIFICAFVGALIGFLWYNAYPAQTFMGDTGSLTLGGIIAVFAIVIHKELLLPVLCGVFLMENASVILQTQYFKFGKRRGKTQRMFKRTPIHDHFRTKDLVEGCTYLVTAPQKVLHEAKITTRFWITTILLAALAIITLKIR